MGFDVREFEPRDYASVFSIYNYAAPPGLSPPSVEAAGWRRCVAVDSVTRAVVGFGEAAEGSVSTLRLMVWPARQRRGVAGLIFERLAKELAEDGTTSMEPWVREENAAGIGWLLKHGFTPIKLDGPVGLYPQEADLSAFGGVEERLAQAGITISTLARERAEDSGCIAKLHALYNEVNGDVPGSENHPVQSLEDFVREQEEPDAMPDGYFIAKDRDAYVGLSYVRPRGADANCVEPGNIQQCLTGVRRAYRRQGVALALKLKTIEFSRKQGYRRLFTNSDNPAMKALNGKLGFVSGPWRVYYRGI